MAFACVLRKALKLHKVRWGSKTQENVLLLCSETNSCCLRLQVTSRVSALSFHLFFRRAVTCYLYATCWLAVCGLPAFISQRKKKKEKNKRTHAANLSSLGKETTCKFHDHSMLLLPILSLWLRFTWTPTEAYGIHLLWCCFCLILTVSMKDSGRRFILWV